MTDSIPDIIENPDVFDADMAFWINAAQTTIRQYCGWHIVPNALIEGSINTRGGTIIRLPARHVTSIISLTDRDGRALPYVYDPDSGMVESPRGSFPTGIAAVRYQAMAGWNERPDVQSVLIAMARRGATAPAGLVTSQATNGSTVALDVITPMREETDKLRPYRLEGML